MSFDLLCFINLPVYLHAVVTHLSGLSVIKQTLSSIQITLMFDDVDISEMAEEEFMKMLCSTGIQ